MKITKQGIVFKTKTGFLTWLWWWGRQEGFKYLTPSGNRFFSIEDYYMTLGARVAPLPAPAEKKKVNGYDYDDIVTMWSELYLKVGCWVVMYDINTQRKPATYWQLMGQSDRMAFTQDLVTLKCKDMGEAYQICNSVDRDFAKAMVIDCGEIVYYNEDYRRLE